MDLTFTRSERKSMIDTNQVKECLIDAGLLINADDVSVDESLFDRGIIDSLGIMSLVTYLEDRFGITIKETDLLPDNFDSIESITIYISKNNSQ